jgi:hypothetical protein
MRESAGRLAGSEITVVFSLPDPWGHKFDSLAA